MVDNPRHDLLLSEHKPSEDKGEWWFKIVFKWEWIWWELLAPDNPSIEWMEETWDKVIEFLVEKIIHWWAKALMDLWADDKVLIHALKNYIKEASELLAFDKNEREEIGLKSRK